MSPRPSSIPVGILVSVSGPSRRRRPRSLADYPPIKKEVNLPQRLAVGVGLGGLLIALAVFAVGLIVAHTRGVPDAKPIQLVNAVQPGGQRPAPVASPLAKPQSPAAPVATAPPAENPFTAFLDRWANRPASATPPAPASVPKPVLERAAPVSSNLGTAVTFFEHPPDAFRLAARENKLVLVVHLSGNFDDPAFT